jgi:hypothetical protein
MILDLQSGRCLANGCNVFAPGECLCPKHWKQLSPEKRREIVFSRNAINRGRLTPESQNRFRNACWAAVCEINAGGDARG